MSKTLTSTLTLQLSAAARRNRVTRLGSIVPRSIETHVALRDAARLGEHDLRETALLSHLADARSEKFGGVRHF